MPELDRIPLMTGFSSGYADSHVASTHRSCDLSCHQLISVFFLLDPEMASRSVSTRDPD